VAGLRHRGLRHWGAAGATQRIADPIRWRKAPAAAGALAGFPVRRPAGSADRLRRQQAG
jgi:hypothetical protein